MTRIPLLLATLSLGACAQRDVSRSMQRSAVQAALQTQLQSAERDARPDDFWLGMDPADDVEMARGALARPVVSTPEPPSDLVEPETVDVDVSGMTASGAPVVPGATASAVPAPNPSESPQGLDALSSLRSSGSSADVVRAIDDLRWTMTLEARLEDKQRLIDALTARLDGTSTTTSSTSRKTAGSSAADKAARAEVEALRQRVLTAEAAARTNAETVAALTARLESDGSEGADASEGVAEAPATEPPALSAEMQAIEVLRSELRDRPSPQDNAELLMAIADLRGQVAGLAAAQQEAEDRSTRRRRGLFRRRRAPAPAPTTPPPPVMPTEVDLSEATEASAPEPTAVDLSEATEASATEPTDADLSTRLTSLTERGFTVRSEDGVFILELPDDGFDGSTLLTDQAVAYLQDVARVLEPFDDLRVEVHGPDGTTPTPSRTSVIQSLKRLGRTASPAASIGTPRVVLTIEPSPQETP